MRGLLAVIAFGVAVYLGGCATAWFFTYAPLWLQGGLIFSFLLGLPIAGMVAVRKWMNK